MVTTTTWTIRAIAPEHPDPALVRGLVAASDAVVVDRWGTDDFCTSETEVLSQLAHQEYTARVRLVGLVDDEVVGYASLDLPVRDNTHTGWLDLGVVPAHRGRGLGTALHGAALDAARAAGRTTLMCSVDQAVEPPEGPGTLAPSTGVGRMRADDPGVRFARAHGWSLEQVERHSRLDVPVDPDLLAGFRADAERAAGPDYRLVTWTDVCPDAYVDSYARLVQSMSTDAPVGGLDLGEDGWDAQRVRTQEQVVAERGDHLLTTAVEHVPTGELAAYSSFHAPARSTQFVWQDDTLVAAAHRGHRLGMLVKAVQLQRLAAERPAVRRVSTWNAEENRWMLAINVALGFRPAGGAGEWQRPLA